MPRLAKVAAVAPIVRPRTNSVSASESSEPISTTSLDAPSVLQLLRHGKASSDATILQLRPTSRANQRLAATLLRSAAEPKGGGTLAVASPGGPSPSGSPVGSPRSRVTGASALDATLLSDLSAPRFNGPAAVMGILGPKMQELQRAVETTALVTSTAGATASFANAGAAPLSTVGANGTAATGTRGAPVTKPLTTRPLSRAATPAGLGATHLFRTEARTLADFEEELRAQHLVPTPSRGGGGDVAVSASRSAATTPPPGASRPTMDATRAMVTRPLSSMHAAPTHEESPSSGAGRPFRAKVYIAAVTSALRANPELGSQFAAACAVKATARRQEHFAKYDGAHFEARNREWMEHHHQHQHHVEGPVGAGRGSSAAGPSRAATPLSSPDGETLADERFALVRQRQQQRDATLLAHWEEELDRVKGVEYSLPRLWAAVLSTLRAHQSWVAVMQRSKRKAVNLLMSSVTTTTAGKLYPGTPDDALQGSQRGPPGPSAGSSRMGSRDVSRRGLQRSDLAPHDLPVAASSPKRRNELASRAVTTTAAIDSAGSLMSFRNSNETGRLVAADKSHYRGIDARLVAYVDPIKQQRRELQQQLTGGTAASGPTAREKMLVARFSRTDFAFYMRVWLRRLKTKSADLIRSLLYRRKDALTIREAMNVFLARCRSIVASWRRAYTAEAGRLELLGLQFDRYTVERMVYTKSVCAEATRELFNRGKYLAQVAKKQKEFSAASLRSESESAAAPSSPAGHAAAASPLPPAVGSPRRTAPPMPLPSWAKGSPSSPSTLRGIGRRESTAAARKASVAAPVPPSTSPSSLPSMEERRALFRAEVGRTIRRLDGFAVWTSKGGGSTSSTAPDKAGIPTPQSDAAALRIASMAPSNPRLGPDPYAAKAFAVATHRIVLFDEVQFAPPPHAKLAVVSYCVKQLRRQMIDDLSGWLDTLKTLRQRHQTLLQILSLVEGVASAKVKDELAGWTWPAKPYRRPLLHPNEMRLCVLVAYDLYQQEKKALFERGVTSGGPLPPSAPPENSATEAAWHLMTGRSMSSAAAAAAAAVAAKPASRGGGGSKRQVTTSSSSVTRGGDAAPPAVVPPDVASVRAVVYHPDRVRQTFVTAFRRMQNDVTHLRGFLLAAAGH